MIHPGYNLRSNRRVIYAYNAGFDPQAALIALLLLGACSASPEPVDSGAILVVEGNAETPLKVPTSAIVPAVRADYKVVPTRRNGFFITPAASAATTDRWIGHWADVGGKGLEIAKDTELGAGYYAISRTDPVSGRPISHVGVANGAAIVILSDENETLQFGAGTLGD